MKTKTINTLRSIIKKNNTDSAGIQGKPKAQVRALQNTNHDHVDLNFH